jgi:hypothetical protein
MVERRRPSSPFESLFPARRVEPSLDDLYRILTPPKHRVFVSYHHKDEPYRTEWDRLFGSIMTNVSVRPGDIDDDNSTEYIKRLIQLEYVTNASVVVVLVGPRTHCRKHVDWEIAAGLNKKVGGYSGLVGIWLPNHPDFGKGRPWNLATTPPRLADNIKSGYAFAYDWTTDAEHVRKWVDAAFDARVTKVDKIDNSRLQYTWNLCD